MRGGGAMGVQSYTVNVLWDEEAKVWVATSEDVPGLVTEADTFEELERHIRELVPILLKANRAMPEPPVRAVPVRLVREGSIELPR